MTDYLHALDGRMRIKINEVKGSSAAAEEITRYLLSLSGVAGLNPTSADYSEGPEKGKPGP
jgi:hypothetical protein